MFNEKKLFITGGTGSIGNSICHYFNNNGCSNIYASTTNLEKVNSNDSFIDYKQLNLSDASVIIHGHTHRPGSYELPSGRKRIVLPDWRIFKDKLSGGGLLLKSSGIYQLSL